MDPNPIKSEGLWEEKPKSSYNPKQREIEFFWPLTEQIPLDLDYGPTHLYYRAKVIAGVHSRPILGSIYEFKDGATWSTNTPQLTVHPTNTVGELKIGGLGIGLEKKPNIVQRLLHRLLGFNWKDN